MQFSDYYESIRYVFGALCLASALWGLRLSLIANALSARGIPREKLVEGYDEPTIMREEVAAKTREVMQRQRFLIQSSKYYKASGSILFASVVAGLTINFPWLAPGGVLIILVALYFYGRYVKEGDSEVAASKKWEDELAESIIDPFNFKAKNEAAQTPPEIIAPKPQEYR